MSKAFLAIDLGATSGRAILGSLEDGKLNMREIHRFPNAMVSLLGRYYWDVYALYSEIKKALFICGREGIKLTSMGIDTWGVDFGYVAPDGSLLTLPRAYRDPYTTGIPQKFFSEKMSSETLYSRTGIQIKEFNSLYQLYAQNLEGSAAQKNAARALFIPDLLSYMLTGNMVTEYTIASTSNFLDPKTKGIDRELVALTGASPELFSKPIFPGTTVGLLSEDLAKETGIGRVPVVAVAGHDTASAVAAIPAVDEHFAYLSSGTWSLLGIETEQPILSPQARKANFTNEGGVEGTTRFLKNITGMWLLEQCREQWNREGKSYGYAQLCEMAQSSHFEGLVDPNDPAFDHPGNMPKAILSYCRQRQIPEPKDDADLVRCIYRSLAHCYGEQMEVLQSLSPFRIERLHIIGGGAQNALLNRWTAEQTGLEVSVGPVEATAIGNIMLQAQAAGLVKNRWEYRNIKS